MVRLNSLKAWVLAARPKTLAGAATPVIMGGGCAWMWMEKSGMLPAEAFDWAAFCRWTPTSSMTISTSARAGTRSSGSGLNGPAHRDGFPPEP